MIFKLILTEEQQTICNSYLHTPENYCWIHQPNNNYYDNIIEYSIIVTYCISTLRDLGWNTYCVDKYISDGDTTLDLSNISAPELSASESESEEGSE